MRAKLLGEMVRRAYDARYDGGSYRGSWASVHTACLRPFPFIMPWHTTYKVAMMVADEVCMVPRT